MRQGQTCRPGTRATAIQRRRLLALAALLPAAGASAAGEFPGRPVTLVVPFPPGGGTDLGARLVAQRLALKWGQPVQIDNRSGAAGLVGAEFAARAKPDGHTLLVGNLGTQAINPSLYPHAPYDPERAFAPVGLIAELPMILVVGMGVPVKSVGEFVALVHQRPGQLSYSSSGSGGAPHVIAEMFKRATGSFIVHLPYRGGAPAVADVIDGKVQMSVISVFEAMSRIKSGKLRALAVTSARRLPVLPAVPTLAETVAPGFVAGSWLGLLAPAGTPADLVEKMAADLREVLAEPELRRGFSELGAVPAAPAASSCSPAAFAQLIDEERKRYARIIREQGIKVD